MSVPVGADLGQEVASTTAGGRTGRFALVEQLLADDIRYMFGNPGTLAIIFHEGHCSTLLGILSMDTSVCENLKINLSNEVTPNVP